MTGVKTLCALVALVALSAIVVAVPASGGSDDGAKATYIVQLVQAPVAGYEGGVAGIEATKPQKGKKLDASSPAVKQYSHYLTGKHDRALDKVGGEKVYDYSTVFNGFAANLTETQAAKLEATKGVVTVEKAETLTLDTSSTPAFLGLSAPGGLWDQLGGVNKADLGVGAGEDVVIGDVDGGYWPENPAFSDRKVGNAKGGLYPHKVSGFTGACQAGENFAATTCNDKVIGARYFIAGMGLENVEENAPYEFISPRDYGGHGTHTASTMAGNYGVQATGDAASFGKLSGIAPRARLAVYKACWVLPGAASGSCNSADTTAAINQAVKDGVDAINYSISGTTTSFTNSVEVSFLFAAAAGVYVSASAGNSGPTAATVAHPSPWITTTAAGTHNRDGKGTVTINGTTYNGATASSVAVSGTLIDSTTAGLAGAKADEVALCYSAAESSDDKPTLDSAKIAGKIVVCDRGGNGRTDKSLAVKEAGGIGMILVNTSPNSINADLHLVPTIHLSGECVTNTTPGDPPVTVTTCPQRDAIKAAAAAGKTAAISKGTIVYDADAPFTASFSSRGPIAAGGGDILKPDIMAPGQDILAAVAPPGNHGRDFDLYSGTSMSSPHMTAIGALMHQAHPDWSPMMIKSALMTTASQSHDYDAFRWGAGHVVPNSAPDPGLVFDSNLNDWLAFLKGQKLYTGAGPSIDASDLNLPSIAIGDLAGSQTVSRTATSVGSATETYTFSTTGLPGLSVTPSVTSFTAAPGSATPWTVTFLRTTAPLSAYSKGFIVWTGDQGHVVKMPVAIQPVKFQAPTEVSGSGTDSSLTFNTKSGYDGNLQYSIRGLEPATKFENTVNGDAACEFDTAKPDDMVATGIATVNEFTTPSAASYIRFQTFQSDASAAAKDLDMFVYRYNAATDKWDLILTSGGPDANEVANTTSAASLTAGAKFRAYVHGCTVGPGPGTFTLFAWAVRNPAANPFTTVPSPHGVTIGQVDATTLGWSGLTAGNRYLGRVQYVDTAVPTAAMASTVIAVSTR